MLEKYGPNSKKVQSLLKLLSTEDKAYKNMATVVLDVARTKEGAQASSKIYHTEQRYNFDNRDERNTNYKSTAEKEDR